MSHAMPLIVLPAPSSVIICRHAVIKGLQYAFLQELRARGKRPQLEAEAPAAAAAAASKATGSSASEAASPDDGAVDAAALAFTANDYSITAANNEEEQQARKLNTLTCSMLPFGEKIQDLSLRSRMQRKERVSSRQNKTAYLSTGSCQWGRGMRKRKMQTGIMTALTQIM